jgi:hypothetical protein
MRYTGIKGKAWEAVKRWCRAVSTDCFTCPARNLVSYNLQAGHYKPVALVGSNNKLSWDERFIRTQCGHCNGAGAGMAREFEERLRKEIGDAAVDEFEANYRRVNPVKNWPAIIEHFDTLTAGMSA